MRRVVLTAFAIASSAAIAAATAAAARADSLCVGRGAGCFATIQPARRRGPRRRRHPRGPRQLPGGITIDKSLTLVGARAGATTIRGGGPVLTIGVLGAATEPTVAIRRLRSPVVARPPARHCGPTCATDFERRPPRRRHRDPTGGRRRHRRDRHDQRQRHLRQPRRPGQDGSEPRSICPTGPCRFALAGGGGIDNWGVLTLRNSTVGTTVPAARSTARPRAAASSRRSRDADAREQRGGRQPFDRLRAERPLRRGWRHLRGRRHAHDPRRCREPQRALRSTRCCRTTSGSWRTARASISATRPRRRSPAPGSTATA